ncbi:MAG: hypothetical protein SPH68_03170 [Candidatus Borkfalkiaceae bacterium]|nr:hypothetical protein [Clostridia bacterium]MDY6223146.1 hypothetical protein [Christensenellaceae bacterium]
MRFFSCVEKAILPYPLIVCSVGGAFFAFFLACFLRKTSAFFFCGGAFALVGVFAAGVCGAFSAQDKKAFYISLYLLYALLYAAYLCHARFAVKREARRRRFEQMKLRREYVLPERGNGYVRDKLRENALASGAYQAQKSNADTYRYSHAPQQSEVNNAREKEAADAQNVEEEKYEEAHIELAHAHGLLKKLKKSELSLSDRLETQRLEESLSAFSGAERLTAEEVRALSDCFSALLKLTAKYVV